METKQPNFDEQLALHAEKQELERKIIERCLSCRHLKQLTGARLVCKVSAGRCPSKRVQGWRKELERRKDE